MRDLVGSSYLAREVRCHDGGAKLALFFGGSQLGN